MPRLLITLAYTGTAFAGWQIQPGLRTVQGELESAAGHILNAPARVHSAARTDAGVHALGQRVHLDVPDGREAIPWQRALNALLPMDMSVTQVRRVEPDFHARFAATAKTYAYTLWTEGEYLLPQRRPFVWRQPRLDHDAMVEAARHFLGTQDFAAFQNAGTPVSSTVRTLTSIGPEPGMLRQEIVWRLRGDGFLKQMVRNIMGCLTAVGRGALLPSDVPRLLADRDRSLAPETAPAWGLCLERVHYPDDDL